MSLWGPAQEQTPKLKRHPAFHSQILRRQTANSINPKQSCLKNRAMSEVAGLTPPSI